MDFGCLRKLSQKSLLFTLSLLREISERLHLISSDNANLLASLKIDLICLIQESTLAGLLSGLST